MLRSPRVVCARAVPFSADAVWERLADLSEHGRLVPLTKMEAPARTTVVGDVIIARTAGFFVDSMVTQSVAASGGDPDDVGWARVAIFRKEGPVLRGFAGVAVRSEGPGGCTVLWAEDVVVPWTGVAARFVEPVLDSALRVMGWFALRRMARIFHG